MNSIVFMLQMQLFLAKLTGQPIGLTALNMFVIDKPVILTASSPGLFQGRIWLTHCDQRYLSLLDKVMSCNQGNHINKLEPPLVKFQ